MLQRMKEFLDRNSIRYVQLSHSPAYTSTEIATAAHLPGKEMAKTVIAQVNGKPVMLVLPASTMVDFTGLRKTLDATEVRLASESEFNKLFPDCEVGAMPPFGNLFNVEVIVDRGLTGQHEIAFNAGNHREMIRMSYPDFERLVRPRILSFSAMQKAHDGGVDVA